MPGGRRAGEQTRGRGSRLAGVWSASLPANGAKNRGVLLTLWASPLSLYRFLSFPLSFDVFSSLSLSVSLCIIFSFSLCIHITFSLSLHIYLPLSLSISLPLDLYIYISICLHIYMFIYLSIYIYVYLSAYQSNYMHEHIFVCGYVNGCFCA